MNWTDEKEIRIDLTGDILEDYKTIREIHSDILEKWLEAKRDIFMEKRIQKRDASVIVMEPGGTGPAMGPISLEEARYLERKKDGLVHPKCYTKLI